jgi:oligopeptide/dipeptide ABC transporter ATP-binding protein
VAHISHRISVMYLGEIVEAGTVRQLFNAPQHPYTSGLIGSMPRLGSKEKLLAIPGQPPDLASLPSGCAFHPRCPEALARCARDEPVETRVDACWTARCWRAEPRSETTMSESHAAAIAGS